MKIPQRVIDTALPFVGIVLFLGIWQFTVTMGVVDPVLFPSPGATFQAVWDGLFGGGRLGYDYLKTIQRALTGMALAFVIGIPVGLVLGASERVYRSIEFIVDFFRSTPTTAMIPLFLLLLGVRDSTKIYIATWGACLAIIFNVAYGVMNARKTRVLAAKVMGASAFDRMLVVFFESLPQTFIGLRTGATIAMLSMITSEMLIGSVDGLGLRVFEEQQLFNMPGMYAAIFCAGLLGYGINLAFVLTENRFVHWKGK